MIKAELKIVVGKHQGGTIRLTEKRFMIGREEDCHLRPKSELVSRHHCVFSIDDYAVRLRDLGSTNGTFVNGVPCRTEVLLKSGDRVSVGKLEFEVLIQKGQEFNRLNDSKELRAPDSPTQFTNQRPPEHRTAFAAQRLAKIPADDIGGK